MSNLLLYFRGRVALAEILISSGIVEGDKVAIQAYTCSAVPEGVYASKATPLYIDVVKEGVTMSHNDLEAKLDNTKNVKAIVIQHTFGIVANLEKIIEIAKKNNLIILLAFIFKQIFFRLNEKVNFIQIACLGYIFKDFSSNLLDMLPIISPGLMTLVLCFLSSHVFLGYKETKEN